MLATTDLYGEKIKKIENNPLFWENNPANVSDLTAEELLERFEAKF